MRKDMFDTQEHGQIGPYFLEFYQRCLKYVV
jgi:hypothetical protein